jgi:hypothetical protein
VKTAKPRNYLSNKNLLAEIARCKRTYCSLHSDEDWAYVALVHDLSQVVGAEGVVVRVMTDDHIPIMNKRLSDGRIVQRRPWLPFASFSHYRYSRGQWHEVLRSHWQGSISNGFYNSASGRPTEEMAKMWIKMVERISLKPNFRGYSYLDEMQAKAIANLAQNGLKFNEANGNNPFAFLTTCVINSFVSVLNKEKKVQLLRDTLLEENGMRPSHSRLAERNDGSY